MKKTWAALALSLPLATAAGNAGPGTLNTVHVLAGGVLLFHTTGARTAVPACGASLPARFAVDATTPAGKAQMAGLLTAYTSGKTVVIFGTGNCGVWGDTETVNYFHTVD